MVRPRDCLPEWCAARTLTGAGEQRARQRNPRNGSRAQIYAEQGSSPASSRYTRLFMVLHRREPDPAGRRGDVLALANCHAYMLDTPTWRTLPARTTSCKARMVSSIGVSEFNRWNWYRSTWSVPAGPEGVDAGHDVLAGQPPIVRTDPIGSRPLSRPAEAPLDGFPGARVEIGRASCRERVLTDV